MKNVRVISFQVDFVDFHKAWQLASKRGKTMAEFCREAIAHYSSYLEQLEELPSVDGKISLATDVEEIQTTDPQPEPTPISDILNYRK